MSDELKCKSCRYYMPHFIISGTQYLPIDGHCINGELYKMHRRNKCRLIENCDRWEPREIAIIKKREHIRNVICNMEEHLSDILKILEAYEQE